MAKLCAHQAHVLAMMGRTTSGLKNSPIPPAGLSEGDEGANATSWDINVFVLGVKSVAPSLDWFKVVRQLDTPHFRVTTVDGLRLIISSFVLAQGEPLPVNVFLGMLIFFLRACLLLQFLLRRACR